jgi:hypothetical protein
LRGSKPVLLNTKIVYLVLKSSAYNFIFERFSRAYTCSFRLSKTTISLQNSSATISSRMPTSASFHVSTNRYLRGDKPTQKFSKNSISLLSFRRHIFYIIFFYIKHRLKLLFWRTKNIFGHMSDCTGDTSHADMYRRLVDRIL